MFLVCVLLIAFRLNIYLSIRITQNANENFSMLRGNSSKVAVESVFCSGICWKIFSLCLLFVSLMQCWAAFRRVRSAKFWL